MGEKIIAVITIAMGVIILSLGIIFKIRNLLKGRKILDGKITGINHDEQSLRIRYKIDNNTYQDIDYRCASYFLSGKIPPVGLKLTVTVNKDDPYCPVSVLILTGSPRVTRKGYLNDSRAKQALRFALLSSLFIIGGIFEWYNGV